MTRIAVFASILGALASLGALVLPLLMKTASPANVLIGPAISLLVFVLAFTALRNQRKRWVYWALAASSLLVAALWGVGVAAVLARQAPNSAIAMSVGCVIPAILVAIALFTRATRAQLTGLGR